MTPEPDNGVQSSEEDSEQSENEAVEEQVTEEANDETEEDNTTFKDLVSTTCMCNFFIFRAFATRNSQIELV